MEQKRNIRVAIAGAGPAGLTVAYDLAKYKSSIKSFEPIVYESSDMIGGISKTVNHNGNRIDIGGHRFFSKNEEIMKRWQQLIPLQDCPAKDEILIRKQGGVSKLGDSDPEYKDRVLLKRNRVSRIFYLRKFFDYPVSLSINTLRSMGLGRTIRAGVGYIGSNLKKLPETSLENFYINRFGKPLYKMFFEDYTEKVWGKHPSELGADWGSQRVKGLSIFAILKDMISKKFFSKRDNSKVETSLIEEFLYPKHGPGQLWETVAKEAEEFGAKIQMETTVKEIHVNNNKVVSVTVEDKHGYNKTEDCDIFVSSMPIKDLIASIRGIEIPKDVMRISAELPYRDFITVGVLVDKLKIENGTKIETYKNRIPDTWIYIQEREVKLGRIQIFNNWSPYMVADYENTVWIGMEYFCTEGDWMWEMGDKEFIELAIKELESIGIIDANSVIDTVRIKIKKAYPAYYGSYYELDKVKDFLDKIENLYCVGRNGQHRYNNMDHSMLTGIETANAIINEKKDKKDIWNVNTETEYHESK